MSNMNDFVIENGVLKRYLGPDGDVEIPDGVTCIGFQAFLACRTYKGYGPMKVTIPDGVTSVETGAFEACDCLTSITIPDSVTSIGGAAFRNCKRLKYITIPGSVLSIGDSAFFGCKTLMNVILQEGITKIGKFAFEDCFALKEIAVPKSVTELGACAFHYSANVLLPAGLTLQYFWIENETLKKYAGQEGDVIIPEGVSRIDDEAFAPFNAFVEERQPFCVTLPASLKKIENHAFRSSRVSGFQADDSSTVFKSSNLPQEEIQIIYAKKGTLHMTQLEENDEYQPLCEYGIIQYDYQFSNDETIVNINTFGNAGQYFVSKTRSSDSDE